MRLTRVFIVVFGVYLACSKPLSRRHYIKRNRAISVAHAHHHRARRQAPLEIDQGSVPIAAGMVKDCARYYVPHSGEFCYEVAEKYGLNVSTFMSWNPSVNPPSCSDMQSGHAYCVAISKSSATLSSPSARTSTVRSSGCSAMQPTTLGSIPKPKFESDPTSTSTHASKSSAIAACGHDVYRDYSGDGSVSDGWPSMAEWIDFDCMFAQNTPIMQASCVQWGAANDSNTEIQGIRKAIDQVSALSNIDPRFILAITMQESSGCVRVLTTDAGVRNPGLMQSHDGTGTCNSAGTVQVPCPYKEIYQMIYDGTLGTSAGDGLVQCMEKQGHTDTSRWYRTARLYNGGSIQYPQDLSQGCCTASYASDIANRLTGWTTAPRDMRF